MIIIHKNAIKCDECGSVVESKTRHDYVSCACGAISVDGGHDYLRRVIKPGASYTDLSETEDNEF